MANSKLTFNVLTFDHPAPEYTFHFYKEDGENLQRVYHTLVPDEVKEHFGEQEFYYTSFEEKLDGALAVTKLSKPAYNQTPSSPSFVPRGIWLIVFNDISFLK